MLKGVCIHLRVTWRLQSSFAVFDCILKVVEAPWRAAAEEAWAPALLPLDTVATAVLKF